MILSILGIILFMICVPFCAGLLPTRMLSKERRSYGFVFVNGYICSIVVFEVLYLCFVFAGSTSVKLLTPVYAVVMLLYAVVSAVFGGRIIKDCERNRKDNKITFFMVLFLVFVAGQFAMRLLQQVSDGDDAFFVATANISAQSGYMNYIQPYTGIVTQAVDKRHVLSGLPVWIAVLSRLTGVHASVMAHCIIGIVVLILHYCIVYETAALLFGEKKEPLGIFCFTAALFNVFGNVSLYTPQTFLMTRTWQGKTMLANLAIPLCFLLLLMLYRNRKKAESIWGSVVMLCITAFFALTCATSGVMIMVPVPLLAIVILLFTQKADAGDSPKETKHEKDENAPANGGGR